MQWKTLIKIIVFIVLSFFIHGSSVPASVDHGNSGELIIKSEISKKLFNVEEAFKYTYIVNPTREGVAAGEYERSPDGSKILVVTRNGDWEKLTVNYTVWIYPRNLIENALHGGLSEGEVATGRPLIHWVTSSKMRQFGVFLRKPAIHSFRWSLDGTKIFFIGKEDEKPDQVYEVEIKSGIIRQITDSEWPIVSYDLNSEQERIIYIQKASPYALDGNVYSHTVVGTNNIWDALFSKYSRYSVQSGTMQVVVQIGWKNLRKTVVAQFSSLQGVPLWMSPDGAYAVVPLPAAGTEAQTHGNAVSSLLPDEPSEIALLPSYSEVRPKSQKFYLIDTTNGNVRLLVDAPIVSSEPDVVWSSDSRQVSVAVVEIPKRNNKTTERFRAGYLVDYFIGSNTIKKTEIIKNVNHAAINNVRINKFDKNTIVMSYVDLSGQKVVYRSYKKREGVWALVAYEMDNKKQDVHDFDLIWKEDYNVPADLWAKSRESGREVRLTNLNPQIRTIDFGKASPFQWKDAEGRIWLGTLVFPVGYASGKRYPLVIQVRGNQPGEFLVGGYQGSTAPFAARPLASAGFMVLNMNMIPEKHTGFTLEKMPSIMEAGISSAVSLLASSGLIDQNLIGLTGWSMSGAPAVNILTFGRVRIAASIVADAIGSSMSGYTSIFGFSAPGMYYTELMYGGAKPFGNFLDDWVAKNPVFHLEKVKTPLLFQQYIPGSLIAWWDVYAILRRQGKPVEMVQYHDADHIPLRPDHFLHAQQMVVDWYSFWLMGKKDGNRVKSSQYSRWEELRKRSMQHSKESQFEQ